VPTLATVTGNVNKIKRERDRQTDRQTEITDNANLKQQNRIR